MDKIANAFKNKKANIAYLVAGYPSLDYTASAISMLDESVVDVLELGIPYSDPLADGKIIASASFEAAKNGIHADCVFDMIIDLKSKKDIKKPIVFLVYFNTILAYGINEFIARSVEAGISGFIVPDLPFEESVQLMNICFKNNIALIPLISVTSVDRIKFVTEFKSGFVYLVGAIGVSGSKKASTQRLIDTSNQIRKISNLPIAVGFGVKDSNDVADVFSYADGAIIGTQIVKQSSQMSVCKLFEYINKLFSV